MPASLIPRSRRPAMIFWWPLAHNDIRLEYYAALYPCFWIPYRDAVKAHG
jgi:hypothetical protein